MNAEETQVRAHTPKTREKERRDTKGNRDLERGEKDRHRQRRERQRVCKGREKPRERNERTERREMGRERISSEPKPELYPGKERKQRR